MSLTLVIFATFFFSLVFADPIQQLHEHVEATDNRVSGLSQASINFTLDFYKVLQEDENPDIVFSPLGIQTLYSAFLHGASDKTYNQLLHGLRLDSTATGAIDEEMHKVSLLADTCTYTFERMYWNNCLICFADVGRIQKKS